MPHSMDAPIWRRHAQRLRNVAQECSDPKLRDQLARIASAWMEKATIKATSVRA